MTRGHHQPTRIESDLAWNNYERVMKQIGGRWPHEFPFTIYLSPNKTLVHVRVQWAVAVPPINQVEAEIFKAHCDAVLEPYKKAYAVNDRYTLDCIRRDMVHEFITDGLYPGLIDVVCESHKPNNEET